MSERIGRRGALTMLVAMTLATGVGLLAWGPMPIGTSAHAYADARTWLGIPNASNVLVNLPLFWLAVWGWCATRASGWPSWLRTPWQWFHLFAMATALTSGLYHAAPNDTLFVISHIGQASAFTLLTLGVLAERVDARFGSVACCVMSVVAIALTGGAMAYAVRIDGPIDMRPLMLLEILPVLLIPTGALGLRGSHTEASTWFVVLALYASSKLFDVGDPAIFGLSGGRIGGHALMHLSLSVVVGWMAYCAAVAGPGRPSGAAVSGSSQRQTSLNTVG